MGSTSSILPAETPCTSPSFYGTAGSFVHTHHRRTRDKAKLSRSKRTPCEAHEGLAFDTRAPCVDPAWRPPSRTRYACTACWMRPPKPSSNNGVGVNRSFLGSRQLLLTPITCPNHLPGTSSANWGYFLTSIDNEANLSPQICSEHARAVAAFAALF
jgi:hypothetical protein